MSASRNRSKLDNGLFFSCEAIGKTMGSGGSARVTVFVRAIVGRRTLGCFSPFMVKVDLIADQLCSRRGAVVCLIWGFRAEPRRSVGRGFALAFPKGSSMLGEGFGSSLCDDGFNE